MRARFGVGAALAGLVAAGTAWAQPVTPISSVNANNAQGFSLLEFQTVTIEGVAQIGSGVLDPFDAAGASTWFYVADGTGGVAIAHSGQLRAAAAGTRVRVTALVLTQGVAPIRGTRTLDLGAGGGSLTVIGSGAVDPPVAIGAADLLTSGAAWEGTRVRIAGLSLVDAGEWPTAGGSAFVRVTDGTSVIRMYVDDDTNISGSSPPAAAFDLIGFVAQDDPSPPFLDGHHVYPASLADLVAGDGSGVVAVDPAAVASGQTDVSLAFTLTGVEAELAGFEVDLPASWTWSVPADPALSGPGFAGAVPGFRFEGGVWILSASGAAVTSGSTGTLTVAGLVAPVAVGSYAFPTRTATAAGTLTPTARFPQVSVTTEASPGDVLVNEIYCVTTPLSGGREEPEFVELRNMTAVDLDIGGWTLADIGRTSSCGLDSRWAFPAGTILPANDFVVVCRTALDPQNPGNPNDDVGFKVAFPAFPPSPSVQLFETFDAQAELPRMDDPATPNMVLVDPTGSDDQLALLGGPITNGGQCESPNVPGRFVPFAELVALADAGGRRIDTIALQELGPCTFDFCAGAGAGGAYGAGPPKAGHTLGRDAASTDRPDSWEDLLPSSDPTPGEPNRPGDTAPPALIVDPGEAALSASMVEIRWDEPVFDAIATDPAHYAVTVDASGDPVEVVQVLPDPEEPGRHYYIVTAGMDAGATGRIDVTGVPDVAVGPGGTIVEGPNLSAATGTFTVPPQALPVCRIQEFDEIGFSPFTGDTVLVAGLVTVGDIPPNVIIERMSIWVQEPGGCGVNVFAFDPAGTDLSEFGVRLNDLVQIRGVVTEFVSSSSGGGAVTEIVAIPEDPGFYRFLLRGLDGPTPIEVSTHAANDERLEGTLVHTRGVVINANSLAAYIDDGSGAIQVFQNFSSLDLTRFTVGDDLVVTGIITQFDSNPPYFSGYELVPQNQAAIDFAEGSGFAPGGPAIEVQKRVLVPDLGETIRITATSPYRSQMIVEIYDMLGRKVTTLYDGVGLGTQTFDWNGVNQWGSVVDAGAYLCHVRATSLDGGPVKTASAPIIVGLRLNGGGP